MNFLQTRHNSPRFISRNEGKIKSYESCSDVRAWSHDNWQRDRYLREWIKSDMPICVIPVNTLSGLLNTMTRRSRRRATPKCHPDCKSKILLTSICNSCDVMKECLKDNQIFYKYFEEEEFETCNWPCERCLDILKRIKMFWKITVEKIFGINISKVEEFDTSHSSQADSVQSVAKLWEKEIVQQAMYVKNLTPFIKKRLGAGINSQDKNGNVRDDTLIPPPKSSKAEDLSLKKRSIYSNISQNAKATDTASLASYNRKTSHGQAIPKKINRSTSFRLKTADMACDTCNLDKNDEEIKGYKHNLQYLQEKYIHQENEVESLKRENKSLKLELNNFYKTCSWKSTFYTPAKIKPSSHASVVPKPFESCDLDDSENLVKNIDSEMVITMKNCKNESYRYVSLLQVIHKTNEHPINEYDNIDGPCYLNENPIDILTKVQNTFGEIVRREMNAANKTTSANKSEISASFHRINYNKSAPSCATISSNHR